MSGLSFLLVGSYVVYSPLIRLQGFGCWRVGIGSAEYLSLELPQFGVGGCLGAAQLEVIHGVNRIELIQIKVFVAFDLRADLVKVLPDFCYDSYDGGGAERGFFRGLNRFFISWARDTSYEFLSMSRRRIVKSLNFSLYL